MWRIMRLIIVIMTAFLMQVSASTFGQQLTIKNDRITLRAIFSQIRKQTGYNVLATSSLLNKARPVSLDLYQVPLADALKKILAGQHLDYTIKNKAIFISEQEAPSFLDRVVDAFTPPVDVRGTVVDEKGMPLPGANVKVKGFKQAAVTDNEGRFYLPGVDDKAVLIVSFVGYKDVEVGAKASLSVVLELKSSELEEVVVAYGKTTQRANVGAVQVIKGEDIQNIPNRSVDKSLQGLVPGLLVTSGTGQPGGGLSNFVLRGIATASSGGFGLTNSTLRNPLIVVDGVPVFQDAQVGEIRARSQIEVPNNNPMAQLNPSDIESISVLKDAAAIALYGSTASNGVILITTKKGKAGRTAINFRSQVDIASRIQTDIELVNQQEYLELLYETYRNSAPGITDAAILADLKTKFPTRQDGSFYPYADLTPLLYNNKATTFGNDLSISGGNDRTAFFTNFEWTKENGIFRTTGFDRKSLRFNFDHQPTDWLKIGLNTSLSYNLQDIAPYSPTPVYGSIFYAYPLNPVFLENGEYYLNYSVPAGETNPVAANEFNKNRNTSYRGLSSLFAELKIIKDLRFKSTLGLDYLSTEAKTKNDPRLFDRQLRKTGLGRIYEANIRNVNLISTNTLSFTKTIAKDHTLHLLAGQEARIKTKKVNTIEGIGLLFFTDSQIDNTSSRDSRGNEEKQTALSYFGQLNYGFRDKYFLSGSIRVDGYSQFGDKQPFNIFGSIGVGWIISAESFMKGARRWLDYLKIRSSFGPSGNASAINRYTKFQQLLPLNYLDASTVAVLPEYISGSPANPLIKPERTTTWDMGLELKVLNNRLSLNADVYHRKTIDLIFMADLPLSSGFTAVNDNLGDIVNKGAELSLSVDIIKSRNFNWNLAANWSVNKNKLVRSNSSLPVFQFGANNVVANAEGHNFDSFYMPVWAGVDPATGSGMFIDTLGKPNVNYNAAKKEWTGKPQPDGFGSLSNSFNYKRITLSFQFYYQYGFQLYGGNRSLVNDGASLYDNQAKEALNRWQKPGDIAVNPKRKASNPDYSRQSTRNLANGDYIRLQTISLAYNLPQTLIRKVYLSNLRIYAQGYNLATWSVRKTSLWDVGNVNVLGQLGTQYPVAKSFSIGINASF